jgi:hypothetical protein
MLPLSYKFSLQIMQAMKTRVRITEAIQAKPFVTEDIFKLIY